MRIVHTESSLVPAVAVPIARKRPKAIRALMGWFQANRCDVVSTHSSMDSWLTAAMLDAMERIYREASGRASVSFQPAFFRYQALKYFRKL